jgi:hypothetical protein
MVKSPQKILRAIAILLAILCVGCGDSLSGGAADGTAGDSKYGDFQFPDGAVLDPESGVLVDPETGEAIIYREIILLHDTSFPIQLKIQDETPIRAKVVDYSAGVPAVDTPVTYEIVKNEGFEGGAGDGSMAAKTAWTDDQAVVSNLFRAGWIGEVNYRIKLSAEGAEDRFIDVVVSDAPAGAIEVHLSYEGPININTIKVRLMPKTFNCGTFQPTYNPVGSLGDKTVLDVNATPVFGGLAAGSHYTVIATGKSPTGSLAAAGCHDGVFVLEGQTTITTLNLFLLPLNPAGTYDVENVFDFTGALQGFGTFGEVIEGIVTLFNNPGKFLIDQIKSLVKQFIGELITDLAFGLFEDQLADIITDWVKNDSPDWVQDFFTIGDDLTQIVDNLHLLSVLKISKLSNDYYVQGTQYWNGIVLTWKLGCDKNAPDYDTCGVMTFSMEELGNTQFPQDVIEGQFTGSIVNYDQLYIDNHVIMISYGKLILFVLNEIILKTLTGENTLKDAALKFVNCPKLADTFANSILDALGLTEKKLADYCESVVGFLVTPIETWIGNLAIDSQLRLTGHCTLVDDTEDLYVDKLIDGVYAGTIEQGGVPGPSFVGTFEGVKAPMPGQ